MEETGTVETVVNKVAESIGEILANGSLVVEELLNETNKTSESFKASTEGLFLAYSSLAIMALIPKIVIVGSFKSVRHQTTQKS